MTIADEIREDLKSTSDYMQKHQNDVIEHPDYYLTDKDNDI
jgi:hypothetical protein